MWLFWHSRKQDICEKFKIKMLRFFMKRSIPGMSSGDEVCLVCSSVSVFLPRIKTILFDRCCASPPPLSWVIVQYLKLSNWQQALIRFLPQRLNRNWVKQGILGGTTWRAERQMKSILKYPFVRNSITTVFSSFAFTDEYGSQNHHSWPLEYFLKKYFFHPLAKHNNITQYNSATQANTCKLDAYKVDIYWFTKNPKKRVSFKEFWYFDPWERSELLLLWESKIRSHESIVFNLPEIYQDKPHLHSIIIVSTWCTRGKREEAPYKEIVTENHREHNII